MVLNILLVLSPFFVYVYICLRVCACVCVCFEFFLSSENMFGISSRQCVSNETLIYKCL